MRNAVLAGALVAGAITSLTTGTQDAAAEQIGGEGWTAAIQHQTGPEDDQGRLVMVRPQGGIVPVGEVSDDARILDVSADGRRVLTARDQSGRTRVTSWDTDTGQADYFRIAMGSADLSFGGEGIIEAPVAKDASTVTVRSYDGSPKTSYPTSPPGSEQPYRSVAVSPDGNHLIESTDKIVVRDAATGKTTKTVAFPEEQTAKRQCDVQRAWGNSAVAVQCYDTDGIGNEDVYRVSFAGDTSRSARARSEVWPTSSGVVYDSHGGNGPAGWVLKDASGEHDLPLGQRGDVTGSRGNQVYVASSPYDPAKGSTLFTHDVKTGKRVTLAGSETTGGGLITDAQTIDGNQ